MYREHHPLAYDTGRGEKLIGSLTGREVLWWGLGLFLTYQMAQVVPPLPLSNFVFRYVHYLLPLAGTLLLCYGREGKSGMTLFSYIVSYLLFIRRQRTFVWQKTQEDLK